MPPVAATPAQPHKLKLLRRKSPLFDFCHCQNLTMPRRSRLKLVHPSRLVQRISLVPWRKKVEHCTQSHTHAMIQKIDDRFEPSTVNVADNPLHVVRSAKKNTVLFDPILTLILQLSPTVIKQYLNTFSNSDKTVFENCRFYRQN